MEISILILVKEIQFSVCREDCVFIYFTGSSQEFTCSAGVTFRNFKDFIQIAHVGCLFQQFHDLCHFTLAGKQTKIISCL